MEKKSYHCISRKRSLTMGCKNLLGARQSKIIFLNGASNSGRHLIAKELQDILVEPFLHIGIENFMQMMPNAYINDNEKAKFGFYTKKLVDENGIESDINSAGYYGKRVMMGMAYTCRILAQTGLNLIIDEVCYTKAQFEVYKHLLSNFQFFTVGVMCPLNELIKRQEHKWIYKNKEFARSESKLLHKDIEYDFTVDTSINTPNDCAKKIKENFHAKYRVKFAQ